MHIVHLFICRIYRLSLHAHARCSDCKGTWSIYSSSRVLSKMAFMISFLSVLSLLCISACPANSVPCIPACPGHKIHVNHFACDCPNRFIHSLWRNIFSILLSMLCESVTVAEAHPDLPVTHLLPVPPQFPCACCMQWLQRHLIYLLHLFNFDRR